MGMQNDTAIWQFLKLSILYMIEKWCSLIFKELKTYLHTKSRMDVCSCFIHDWQNSDGKMPLSRQMDKLWYIQITNIVA